MRRLIRVALLAALVAAGCSKDAPTTPSTLSPGTGTGTSATSNSIAGRVVDIFTSSGLGSVTIRLPDGTSAATASDGSFSLAAPSGSSAVTLSGGGLVERQTALRCPESAASISVIPASFDLSTFDQMCRGGGSSLRRWDSAPKLIIIDAVLQFTDVNAASFLATGERLTTDEVGGLAGDLAWGLPQVTGQAFAAFSSVEVESPAEGAQVQFLRDDHAIVAGRFNGLCSASTYWGYGRWAARSNMVVAGAIMLDRDFERSGSPYRRSLRVHEMGHALGWDHVTSRVSFMNHDARTEPNAFDKDATRLAFLRPPGNRTPDTDPWPLTANMRAPGLVWGEIKP